MIIYKNLFIYKRYLQPYFILVLRIIKIDFIINLEQRISCYFHYVCFETKIIFCTIQIIQFNFTKQNLFDKKQYSKINRSQIENETENKTSIEAKVRTNFLHNEQF